MRMQGALADRIEQLAGSLAAAGSAGDVDSLGGIADEFDRLRAEFRRDPHAFTPHLDRLGSLREEFDRLVRRRITSVADRYFEVTRSLAALEQERERWRDAILRACRDGSTRRVAALRVTIEVSESTTLCVPDSKDPARPKLEEVLRSAGVWEDVSQLSAPRLAQALERGRLPAPVAAEVRRLCPETTRFTVRCRANEAQPGTAARQFVA